MSETRELKAQSILKDVADFFKFDTTAPKEDKKETKEVELESVLEDGTYELADGRSIIIEGGNVTEVMEAAEPEAEPEMEETAELSEEEKAAQAAKLAAETKLSEQAKELETLKAQIVELSTAKPLTAAPQKAAPKQIIELNSNQSYTERLMNGFHNNSN